MDNSTNQTIRRFSQEPEDLYEEKSNEISDGKSSSNTHAVSSSRDVGQTNTIRKEYALLSKLKYW